SKLDGIQAARMTLARAVFHPRCEALGISALEQYRREWDDERKTFRANVVHDWTSHLADAWRYLSMAWRKVPEPAVEKKTPQPIGSVYLPGAPKPDSKVRIRI